ncbi:hypothetical protein [Pseudanabaena sp. 'Roaring Creek']|nr:hypothetical protein [Pseudanabaena sp. 'Roaring Creek']
MGKLFNISISLIASIFVKIIKRDLTEKIAKIRIIRKFLVNIKAVTVY